jgi:hypothetical protein
MPYTMVFPFIHIMAHIATTGQHILKNTYCILVRAHHRYLMSRLSLQVFYLWRHVLSTAPPFILWWSNLEILFAPLHRSSPLIGGLRCQAIQTEHGLYIAERTQKAVFIVRCLWGTSVWLHIQASDIYQHLEGKLIIKSYSKDNIRK